MNSDTITPDYEVVVHWDNQSSHWWNHTCADIMEVFGLPGDRYVSVPTLNFMSFRFKNKRDAELCRILVSEKI